MDLQIKRKAQAPSLTLTALDFKASMLRDGTRVGNEFGCTPTLLPPGALEVEAPVDPEGADEEAAELADDAAEAFVGEGLADGVIALASSMHLEWECSYRKAAPEKKQFRLWRTRFTKMRLRWQVRGNNLVAPQARRPIAEQLSLQREWKNRKLTPKKVKVKLKK